MTSDLIIWLPDDLDAPWAWSLGSHDHGWAASDHDRAALSEKEAAHIRVVCPGQWVRIFAHDLPVVRGRERQQAAGFAVEDQLAGPLSEQHIVLGAGDDKRIAVIARSAIDAAHESLGVAGLTVSHMAADFDVLPEGAAISLIDREVHPGPLGYALDADVDQPGRLPDPASLNWDGAINLMSGAYQQRGRMAIDSRRFLRIAALALIGGVSWLAWQGLDTRAISAQTEFLKSDMNQLYTDATGQPAPANVASVVNRARAGGQSAQIGFLDLSSALFSGLSENENVMVDTLRYDRTRNELVLRLIYPDFESAAQLESAFSNIGYQFQSGAVREQGSDLIGEAVFRAGAGS